jgi:hypothetical protein
MPVGMCRHCGYSPVSDDAPLCPNCGGRNPHPNAASSFFYMCLFFLLGVGAVVGVGAAITYFLTHKG